MRGIALVGGLAVFINLTGAAAEPQSNATQEASLYFTQESILPQLGIDPGDDFTAMGSAVGYDFGNGFKTELENSTTSSANDNNAAIGSFTANRVMLRGLYELNDGAWKLKPYVGAGFGMVDLDQHFLGIAQSDWTPAYEVRGGVNYNISEKLFGRLEYSMTNGEAPHLSLGNLPARVSFANHGVLLGLDYHLQ